MFQENQCFFKFFFTNKKQLLFSTVITTLQTVNHLGGTDIALDFTCQDGGGALDFTCQDGGGVRPSPVRMGEELDLHLSGWGRSPTLQIDPVPVGRLLVPCGGSFIQSKVVPPILHPTEQG